MENNKMLKTNIQTDFLVQHNISTNFVMRDFHFHDVFEIYCTLSNGVRYFVKDRIFNLGKGDIIIFNNMDLHKSLVSLDVEYERYIVLFRPEYIQDMSTAHTNLLEYFLNRSPDFPYVLHLNELQLKSFLLLLDKAQCYCDSPVYGVEIYKRIILVEILLFVNQLYREADPLPNPSYDGEYKRIRPIILYIHNNISSDLSLDSLVEKFFISKHHMGYLFKKTTGFSINEYIINCRIIKAKELLKNGLSVTEVGEKVGFFNLSHFIRTFKAYTGKSPKKYVLSQREL
jgi:AraC-type DNA-binding domain-containing proteins